MKKRYIIIPIIIFVVFVAIMDSFFPDTEGPDPDKWPPKKTQTVATTEVPESNSILEFTLTAGAENEYSSHITLNKGTEFEDTRLVYNVPSGSYTVTNIGEYPTQVNVYTNATHYVNGWEEFVDGEVELLEVGESVVMYVYDDWHFYINKPAKVKMELVSEYTPEPPVVVTTTTVPIETTDPVALKVPVIEEQTAYLGDYVVTLKGATIYAGKLAQNYLVVDYQFTNNSSESKAMAWSVINTAFQNGVELDTATMIYLPEEANYSSDGYFKEAKNGGTVNAQVAYTLEDTANPIEIELTRFFDFSGNPPQVFTITLS